MGNRSEHQVGNAMGEVANSNTAITTGCDISFEDLTASVRDKGWSNLIDLGALTSGGCNQIIMKPVRVEDLNPANTNG